MVQLEPASVAAHTFEEAFQDLKAATEASNAGRAQLSVTHYQGPSDIRIVCQEAFHHNFDLTHEHWAEVCAPSDEAHQGGEVFRRSKETLAFAHIFITGDKAAGKTTFLNGLTTGDLRVLQCLRYDSGLFYNIWYAPSTADMLALRKSLSQRTLPFFQTELAHGGMLMEAGELRFFMEDEEFSEGATISQVTEDILAQSRHVMLKLLEVGGDCLHELLELDTTGKDGSGLHPVKKALLEQTTAAIRAAGRAAYFINLTTLFASDEHVVRDSKADAVGPAALVERLGFLKKLLRHGAEVFLFCTQPPSISFEAARARLSEALSTPLPEFADAAAQTDGTSFLPLVLWVAMHAGLDGDRLRVVCTDHLQPGTDNIDHTAVLQSLRRLLTGDCLKTATSGLALLAEQVAHVLFDNKVAVLTKEELAELLEDFDDDGYAELYRKVVRPMVALPPMVLLDSFVNITAYLCRRGFLCPAGADGQIPLEVEIASEGVVRLRSHSDFGLQARPGGSDDRDDERQAAEVSCWRVLVQQGVVAEASKASSLFQLDGGGAQRVSATSAAAILQEAWSTAAAAWSTMPAAEAFSELYLSSRFLLIVGHEELPASCGFLLSREAASAASCGEPDGIELRMPQHVTHSLDFGHAQKELPVRFASNVFSGKRLRVGGYGKEGTP
eukprot:TRINITY_DN47438_c0_g1_i1.p1 TRINITY_DN47438_c0_g1~~TRINITY_DN47438_c0_g1_i1.p1  ORF type:complete len:669 (-),score=162.80 TRINITY_DN47438_c0_g1_i1:165-2171(-)